MFGQFSCFEGTCHRGKHLERSNFQETISSKNSKLSICRNTLHHMIWCYTYFIEYCWYYLTRIALESLILSTDEIVVRFHRKGLPQVFSEGRFALRGRNAPQAASFEQLVRRSTSILSVTPAGWDQKVTFGQVVRWGLQANWLKKGIGIFTNFDAWNYI